MNRYRFFSLFAGMITSGSTGRVEKVLCLCYSFFLLVISAPFLNPGHVWGATYYVDQNNASAADTNPGTSVSPWKTITKAASSVIAGDTVIVRAGRYIDTDSTYYRGFNTANSGTAGNPITFKSETRGAAVLVAKNSQSVSMGIFERSYIVVDGFKSEGMLKVQASSYVTLENNEVVYGSTEGGDASLNWGLGVHSSHNCTIRNNYVHDLRSSGNTSHNTAAFMLYGGSARGASNNLFEHNTADISNGNVYSGFGQKAGNTNYNVWRYNLAVGGTSGFFLIGSTDETQFSDYNQFYQNVVYQTGDAFQINHNGRYTQVFNNTVFNVKSFVNFLMAKGIISNEFWNNIVHTTGAVYRAEITNPNWTTLMAYADYNNFYQTTYVATYNYGSGHYTTINQWRDNTPYDDHPIVNTVDPQFTNLSTRDFRLLKESTCLAGGRGGSYNTVMGAYVSGSEIIGAGVSTLSPPTFLRIVN